MSLYDFHYLSFLLHSKVKKKCCFLISRVILKQPPSIFQKDVLIRFKHMFWMFITWINLRIYQNVRLNPFPFSPLPFETFQSGSDTQRIIHMPRNSALKRQFGNPVTNFFFFFFWICTSKQTHTNTHSHTHTHTMN